MRIFLPPGGFGIELPENFPQISPNVSIVHHSMWSEFAREGDVCLTDEFEPNQVVDFILKHKCSAVLQRNSAWFSRDLESCIFLKKNPEAFLEDPIRSTITQAQKRLTWEFSKPEDKAIVLEKLNEQIEAGSRGLQESAMVVFEELYMNAMMDAPRHSISSKLETHGYEKHPPAKFHFGVERGRLCLACEDPYGSLDIDVFLQRMNVVYSQGAGQVINLKSESGGAGLGCVMLFEQCGSMYIGVKKDRVSIVACVIPTDVNHRKKDSIRKSLHLIRL